MIPVGTFLFAGQCQIGIIHCFYFDMGRKSDGLYFSSGIVIQNTALRLSSSIIEELIQ